MDHKSTSKCYFSFGFASMSRNQKSVALSTAKAGIIAVSMVSYEVVWLRKLFSELFGHVILYDN